VIVKLLYHYRNKMKASSSPCTKKGELRKERSNKAETGIWGQNFRLSGCRNDRGAEARSPVWEPYHVMRLAR
jgi:hypothetical protein